MSITLKAMIREDKGKGSSRRLRHANRIPAVVYGADKSVLSISLDFHELSHLLVFTDNIFTSVIKVKIDKTNETVIIKDLQRHPSGGQVTHVDFLRISDKRLIIITVPLNFIGHENNSLLRLGAILNQFTNSIKVKCLPKDLPHSIDIDVTNITLEDSVRLTDLVLPKGVVICALVHKDIEAHNQTVVSVSIARKMSAEDLEETQEVVTDTQTDGTSEKSD